MSRSLLIFDTETTGIPEWKIPSEDPCQPHIVQLAAKLVDEETREVKEEMDVIVKPEGWAITPEMTEIHGISHEKAWDEGILEPVALMQFMDMHHQCDLRIAHNTTFDNRIIKIAMARYMSALLDDGEWWKDRDTYFCTLAKSRKIIGGKDGHTLTECYKYFTDKDLEGAHNAMVDVNACMEIYFAMKDLGHI